MKISEKKFFHTYDQLPPQFAHLCYELSLNIKYETTVKIYAKNWV